MLNEIMGLNARLGSASFLTRRGSAFAFLQWSGQLVLMPVWAVLLF